MDFIIVGFNIFNFNHFGDNIFERFHLDINCWHWNSKIENLDEINLIFIFMTHSDQDNFSRINFRYYFQNWDYDSSDLDPYNSNFSANYIN